MRGKVLFIKNIQYQVATFTVLKAKIMTYFDKKIITIQASVIPSKIWRLLVKIYTPNHKWTALLRLSIYANFGLPVTKDIFGSESLFLFENFQTINWPVL